MSSSHRGGAQQSELSATRTPPSSIWIGGISFFFDPKQNTTLAGASALRAESSMPALARKISYAKNKGGPRGTASALTQFKFSLRLFRFHKEVGYSLHKRNRACRHRNIAAQNRVEVVRLAVIEFRIIRILAHARAVQIDTGKETLIP